MIQISSGLFIAESPKSQNQPLDQSMGRTEHLRTQARLGLWLLPGLHRQERQESEQKTTMVGLEEVWYMNDIDIFLEPCNPESNLVYIHIYIIICHHLEHFFEDHIINRSHHQ